MKIERQGDYWLGEQRMDDGLLLLAEGRMRDEAARAIRHMIYQKETYPVMEVTEEFLCEARFNEIFGKR